MGHNLLERRVDSCRAVDRIGIDRWHFIEHPNVVTFDEVIVTAP
jgi:hypothetical protein